MSPDTKEKITAAFEFYGPDAIERGMAAFPWMPIEARPWSCQCFLGRMGQQEGEFIANSLIRMRRLGGEHGKVLEYAYEGGLHADLERLATEWLEAQRVVTADRVVARVASGIA